MTIRVDQPASAPVFMSVDCGEGCGGTLDVSDRLAIAPVGDWSDITVALKCFVAAGADVSKLNVPWRITTSGSFQFTVNAVKLTAPPADLSCPAAVAGVGSP
jgi:beta-glucosidase